MFCVYCRISKSKCQDNAPGTSILQKYTTFLRFNQSLMSTSQISLRLLLDLVTTRSSPWNDSSSPVKIICRNVYNLDEVFLCVLFAVISICTRCNKKKQNFNHTSKLLFQILLCQGHIQTSSILSLLEV